MRRSGFWYKLLCLLLLCGLIFGVLKFVSERYTNVQFAAVSFTESDRELHNPDRGFYDNAGYVVWFTPPETVSEPEDAVQGGLRLVQINLRKFPTCEINPACLEYLDAFFQNQQEAGNRLIVRFLYDWKGNAADYEPENLEIILMHMRQMAPLLEKYRGQIFTLQGLFIGNWGEMNGTSFVDADSLKALSNQLAEVTPDGVYLAVRMPMYWRKITDIAAIHPDMQKDSAIAGRIGLYNDGMLGNASDWGTYGSGEPRSTNPYTYWNRQEELAFQEQLCRYVPNGGEVIADNEYNDFENAIRDLKTMHVTYLNREYDQAVLNKWAACTVREDSCFDGMDGLTYIDRHLGYRYLLSGADLSYSWLSNSMKLTVGLRNVGFAPAYSEKPVTITLKGKSETVTLTPAGDLRDAVGGNESGSVLDLTADIPIADLQENAYDVYLQIWDPVSNSPLELANEQAPGEDGFCLGKISFAHSTLYEAMN